MECSLSWVLELYKLMQKKKHLGRVVQSLIKVTQDEREF